MSEQNPFFLPHFSASSLRSLCILTNCTALVLRAGLCRVLIASVPGNCLFFTSHFYHLCYKLCYKVSGDFYEGVLPFH